MASESDLSPGTVSKILWHFTGGPIWDVSKQRQQRSPKAAAEAYDALLAILKSRKLNVGKYKEIVRAVIPKSRQLNKKNGKWVTKTNVAVSLESSAVCCLADIPAPHLRYHAKRYGKFAIGFHRESVIRAGFNPVLYSLESTRLVKRLCDGFSYLKGVDFGSLIHAIDEIQSEIEHVDISLDGVLDELGDVEWATRAAAVSLKEMLAFTKSFSSKEFSTIYCEREWRSIQPFPFRPDDIAMVVLPKMVSGTRYFRPFVERTSAIIRLPKRVPVVPWEDLIEH